VVLVAGDREVVKVVVWATQDETDTRYQMKHDTLVTLYMFFWKPNSAVQLTLHRRQYTSILIPA
jgi:hypothetical protein